MGIATCTTKLPVVISVRLPMALGDACQRSARAPLSSRRGRWVGAARWAAVAHCTGATMTIGGATVTIVEGTTIVRGIATGDGIGMTADGTIGGGERE